MAIDLIAAGVFNTQMAIRIPASLTRKHADLALERRELDIRSRDVEHSRRPVDNLPRAARF